VNVGAEDDVETVPISKLTLETLDMSETQHALLSIRGEPTRAKVWTTSGRE
jgi:hypothetical protein